MDSGLLDQKKSVQDGIFMCMYTLARGGASDGLRYTYAKLLLEALCIFLVVFSPSISAWDINQDFWCVRACACVCVCRLGCRVQGAWPCVHPLVLLIFMRHVLRTAVHGASSTIGCVRVGFSV